MLRYIGIVALILVLHNYREIRCCCSYMSRPLTDYIKNGEALITVLLNEFQD